MAKCSLLKSHCGTIRAANANTAGLRFLLAKVKGEEKKMPNAAFRK